MRIALVHDYIKEYGGAERVLEELHEIYPKADVFTSVYIPEFLGPHAKRFRSWDIKTTFLQSIPFKHKLISPFRLLSPWAFGKLDFSKYDVIIVSATGAYFPNSIKKGKAIQICYCHTPPRYLYGYATARNWKKNALARFIGESMNHYLRMIDFEVSKNVDYYVANSEEVKSRIKKFYRRDAVVINPPVVLFVKSDTKIKKGDYLIAGGRLARPKNIDLIIETCQQMGLPLKVFGRGFAGYESEIKSILKDTTEFLGEVDDSKKVELIAGARAFINAGEDEDFGILPVEAMAVGTPVIAFRSGGLKETIIEGKTGVFFDELKVDSLRDAIKKFDKLEIRPEDCISHANNYSADSFRKKISSYISKLKV